MLTSPAAGTNLSKRWRQNLYPFTGGWYPRAHYLQCRALPTGYKDIWHLDDQFMGTTKDFHQMALDPPPGIHALTLVDDVGNAIKISFTVRDENK